MSFETKEDILAKWETPEIKAEAKEIAGIRKDIATARNHISDALARYRKAKLKARSKKQAQETPFAELEEYPTRESIRDAYGWELITEARMYHLFDLWDLREKCGKQETVYRDRVTNMLERAMNSLGDEFQEQLLEYDRKRKRIEQEAERIARENNERSWKRRYTQQ